MKRATRFVAAVAATGLCAGGVGFFVVDFGDPGPERRDELAYQGYVTGSYAAGSTSVSDDRPVQDPIEEDWAWAASHPEVMLAEGDRACDWLAEEPDPPFFRYGGPSYATHALTTRYLKVADMDERIDHGNSGQRHVVGGAWGFLCPVMRGEKTLLDSGGD